jgi:HSP90 family molecular chaperone
LDKIRFLGLTDPKALKDFDTLEIRVKANPAEKTITITDTGIGMTRKDLINNLGVNKYYNTRQSQNLELKVF